MAATGASTGAGTALAARVDHVVDGDTVRVFLPANESKSESLRLLALDTEEINPGGKPVTPLGRVASERAKALMPKGAPVTVTLPGDEPADVGLAKHRGNHGRLLCYLTLPDGRDFQEVMIREGLSPYFQKYGYAHFASLHARYVAAEREAQRLGLGIWDPFAGTGASVKNYAALGTWWELRARIIEEYRQAKSAAPGAELWNTRLDYDRLVEIATARGDATVFMELRSLNAAGDHVVFYTGSREHPFTLFLPDGNVPGPGSDILRLLLTRYVAGGEAEPRRSFAYVTGNLRLYPEGPRGQPEIVVTDAAQVTDDPPAWLVAASR